MHSVLASATAFGMTLSTYKYGCEVIKQHVALCVLWAVSCCCGNITCGHFLMVYIYTLCLFVCRGLMFTACIFEELPRASSLQVAVSTAYERTLKPFHNFVVKGIVSVGSASLSSDIHFLFPPVLVLSQAISLVVGLSNELSVPSLLITYRTARLS